MSEESNYGFFRFFFPSPTNLRTTNEENSPESLGFFLGTQHLLLDWVSGSHNDRNTSAGAVNPTAGVSDRDDDTAAALRDVAESDSTRFSGDALHRLGLRLRRVDLSTSLGRYKDERSGKKKKSSQDTPTEKSSAQTTTTDFSAVLDETKGDLRTVHESALEVRHHCLRVEAAFRGQTFHLTSLQFHSTRKRKKRYESVEVRSQKAQFLKVSGTKNK